jgi:hypothetical protein
VRRDRPAVIRAAIKTSLNLVRGPQQVILEAYQPQLAFDCANDVAFGLLWVKTGKSLGEQMFSGLTSKADRSVLSTRP